jgi:hypothetical protein
LEKIDGTRNKIIHWVVLTSETGGKKFNPATDIYLFEQRDLFAGNRILLSELQDFERKCDFIGLLIYYFTLFLKNGDKTKTAPDKTPWQRIFQQPIDYPPKPDHPLFPVGRTLSEPASIICSVISGAPVKEDSGHG